MKASFVVNPRYWFIWMGVAALWLCVQLPYRWQMALGRGLGRVALPFANHRRHVTLTNLRLCFPALSPVELNSLVQRCFESAGIAIFETGMAWWMPTRRLKKLITVKGFAYWHEALTKQRGALILAGHFTTLELAGRVLSLYSPYDGVYRQHKNPVFDFIMCRAREKHIHRAIARDDVRQFIASLKANGSIFYAPDQDYGSKHSLFVPFFGVAAATITSTARIAKLTKTAVLPYFFYRRDDGHGYTATLYPPLEHYPSQDAYQDALRINQIIEQAVLKNPEQYLWQHRRFKTRPMGEACFYKPEKNSDER